MNIKEKEIEEIGTLGGESRKLILFNSSHFWDEVVNQIQKATGYDTQHCEQIAMIAHTKGKAVVMSGDVDKLFPVETVLKEIGLQTEIQ
jgi:ATP-dependent Clp protease adapter protein ClpS